MVSLNYEEAIDWLFSQLPMFSRVGAPAYKPGLETTQRLDEIYKYPHRKFKSIHVGGTNGKGSTSHMIASVLQTQGYKTGLYTSPHLTDFRERIRINGEMIPKSEVSRFVNDWKNKLAREEKKIVGQSPLSPSFFELTMMMAFDWFAHESVDFAVIEVGMGGRLDSTNIIIPILSVITNISFDHTQFLGSTLEEIANEKAGIIKEGIPVVVGEAEGNVKKVFLTKALEQGSPIVFAENTLVESENFDIPLKGSYQKKNLRTVLASLLELEKIGVFLTQESIKDGLAQVDVRTGLRGRWQIVSEQPIIICDTGHNQAGLEETLKGLKDRYPDRTVRFVVGFVNDKDVRHIVNLFPKDGKYYFCKASIPRAMSTEDVAGHFKNTGITGQSFDSVKEAFLEAQKECRKDDIIYIGGSTFIVADFLTYWEEGNH